MLLQGWQCGYARVSLALGARRKRKMALVHRLVAAAFHVGGSGPEVNHKDGDSTNNTLGNLEWCTRAHNVAHAVANGLNSTRRFPVRGTPLLPGYPPVEFPSQRDAEVHLSPGGKGTGMINRVLNGKAKSAYGYRWVRL